MTSVLLGTTDKQLYRWPNLLSTAGIMGLINYFNTVSRCISQLPHLKLSNGAKNRLDPTDKT